MKKRLQIHGSSKDNALTPHSVAVAAQQAIHMMLFMKIDCHRPHGSGHAKPYCKPMVIMLPAMIPLRLALPDLYN